MINLICASVRCFDHVFEELIVRNWSRAVTTTSTKKCWCAVVTFIPACLHSSAVSFGSAFGSLSRTLLWPTAWTCGSDHRTLVNSLEIIFKSCEYPVHWRCLDSNRSPDARLDGIWLAWVQLVVWWWRCGLWMECNRCPDEQIQNLRMGCWTTAVPPIAKLQDWNVSMHLPFSVVTTLCFSVCTWDLDLWGEYVKNGTKLDSTLIIPDSLTDLGLVNSLQHDAMFFPNASLTNFVLKNGPI